MAAAVVPVAYSVFVVVPHDGPAVTTLGFEPVETAPDAELGKSAATPTSKAALNSPVIRRREVFTLANVAMTEKFAT